MQDENGWVEVKRRRGTVRGDQSVQSLSVSNKFSCLAALNETEREIVNNVKAKRPKTEILIIGDSIIKHLDRPFGNSKRKRMVVCYPGARVSDVVDRIDREIADTCEDASVFVHIGMNDVEQNNSEALIADYKRLIRQISVSGRTCIFSGILPRLGVGTEWGSRALAINERVRELCLSEENTTFMDLWDDFQSSELYEGDGVHLNSLGVKRLRTNFECHLSEVLGIVRSKKTIKK